MREHIRQDLAQLNYDLNLTVTKFFSSLQKSLNKYDKYIGNSHSIIPGIDNFNVVINLAEELYPNEKPFSEKMKDRKTQRVIIRQCCYLIGAELGLTFSHMVNTLNARHSEKVVHHATMIHGINKTRTALELKDKVVLPIWSNLLAEMQKRNFSRTFVSLEPIDSL